MSTGNRKPAPTPPAQGSIDWRRVVSTACLKCDWTSVAQIALGSTELAAMVGEALRMIGRSIEADISRVEVEATSATAPPSPPPTEPAPNVDGGKADAPRVDAPTPEQPPVIVDEEVASAAAVLGVSVDASADEIRAALRARLSSSRLHPDQGGDGEQAKILIAAKNLLIERARAGRS